MTKQLIVVVHGVGVKEAGVSSDMLAVSLADIELKPISSDDFNLAEDNLYNVSDKRQIYPCRVRKYSDERRTRVIADFYWGDIANSRKGIWGLWPSFFKVVMGLGHVIRENSYDLYRSSPLGRWITSQIVKNLHGPIVAINLVMLFGVLVAKALQLLIGEFGGGDLAPVVIGSLSIAIGWVLRARAQSYLERLLWCWVILTGFVVLAMQFLELVLPQSVLHVLMPIKTSIQTLICTNAEQECLDAISGIYLDGILLLIFVQVMNLLNMILLFVLTVFLGSSGGNRSKSDVPNLVFPTFMVMTVMWLFLIACAWILAITPWWQLIPHEDIQEFGLRILVIVVPVLLLISVAAGFVWIKRMLWCKDMKQRWPDVDYFKDEIANSETNRMVVSSSLSFVLYPSYLFFTALSAYILVGFSKIEFFETYLFFHYYSYAFGFVMVSAVAITGFAYLIRNGLDVATDIVTYLNDYSWESQRAGTRSTRTFLERWLNLEIPEERKSGYFLRDRIKQRLEMLVSRLIKHEAPDELYLVAHSQGTVIAIDVIDEYGQELRDAVGPDARIGLVTMGSPYTHIHNHYFPSKFPPIEERKKLQSVTKDGVLNSWDNIFRLDDFVGTHVYQPAVQYDDESAWPKEHPVLPNGHTEYWVDVHVAEILKDKLKIQSSC